MLILSGNHLSSSLHFDSFAILWFVSVFWKVAAWCEWVWEPSTRVPDFDLFELSPHALPRKHCHCWCYICRLYNKTSTLLNLFRGDAHHNVLSFQFCHWTVRVMDSFLSIPFAFVTHVDPAVITRMAGTSNTSKSPLGKVDMMRLEVIGANIFLPTSWTIQGHILVVTFTHKCFEKVAHGRRSNTIPSIDVRGIETVVNFHTKQRASIPCSSTALAKGLMMIQCLYDWFGDSDVHSMLDTCHGNVEMSIVGSENDSDISWLKRLWCVDVDLVVSMNVSHMRSILEYTSPRCLVFICLWIPGNLFSLIMDNVVRGYPRWCSQCVSFSLEFPTFIDSTHASTVHPVSFPHVKHKHGEGHHLSCTRPQSDLVVAHFGKCLLLSIFSTLVWLLSSIKTLATCLSRLSTANKRLMHTNRLSFDVWCVGWMRY